MSTISPFVRIEGNVSQPRSRAPCQFPPPFGNEWALLPAESGLRAELAALLRTFCLHDEMIWSMGHWSAAWPQTEQTQQTPPPNTAKQPASHEKPLLIGVATMFLRRDMPDNAATSAQPPDPRHRPVATAFAIGGAAILAWIGIGYLWPVPPSLFETTAQSADAGPDLPVQIAQSGGMTGSATRQAVSSNSSPPLNTTHHARQTTSEAMREAKHTARHRSHPATSQSAKAAKHAPAAHRPLTPSPFRVGEYASATLASRPPVRNNNLTQQTTHGSSASETDWMNHIEQRRVTEVPDQFSM